MSDIFFDTHDKKWQKKKKLLTVTQVKNQIQA